MHQADHRGVVQIQKSSAFLKVYTKVESLVGLIPVAAQYVHGDLRDFSNEEW